MVWRGTEFGFLNHVDNSLRKFSPVELEGRASMWEKKNRIPHGRNKPRAAAYAMAQAYENLIPRWQGVFWTAEAEFDAQYTSSTLPWADIKFTTFPSHTEDIQKMEEHGIDAVGERIELEELAKYKYHLDIGGAGGKIQIVPIYAIVIIYFVLVLFGSSCLKKHRPALFRCCCRYNMEWHHHKACDARLAFSPRHTH